MIFMDQNQGDSNAIQTKVMDTAQQVLCRHTRHMQRNTFERLDRAVEDVEVFQFEDRLGHATSSSSAPR